MKMAALLQFARCACRPCRDRPFEGRLFLCHRNDDARSATTGLYNRLVAVPGIGRDGVFRYQVNIGPGMPYPDEIRRELESSYAVLVVIGPKWLDVSNKDGVPRITEPDDMVRQEVELALAAHGQVLTIPVLVNDAKMPTADQLPDSIKRLAYRVAYEVPADDFDRGTRGLVRYLQAPPTAKFASWKDIRLAGSRGLLILNALLRPLWSNVLLPIGLIVAGLLIEGARWLLPVGLVLWFSLATVTLFDRRQLRCAERCLREAKLSEEDKRLSSVTQP